jgi:hypothetical protein
MRSFHARGGPGAHVKFQILFRAGILSSLGLILVAAALIAPALAQTPRSLLPTKPLEFKLAPGSNDRSKSPGPNETPELVPPAGGGSQEVTASGKLGISVNSLGVLAGESVGTLDATSGGFDAEMWQGTPRGTIDSLISLLPATVESRVLWVLRKRLLLTTAAVPPTLAAATESLLSRRARALFQAGDLPALAELLAVVPPTHQEEALSKLGADVAFVTNDLASACDTVASWVERSRDRYWQKALVFCEALNGAWERVDFGMRLLIELDEDDETFFALMRAIGGETGTSNGLDVNSLRGLDVAMARAARVGLPDPGTETPPRWLFQSYMDDPGIEPATRFAIAEEAERSGLLGRSELTRIYAAMQVSPELLESASSVASADPGPTGRALLFRATLAQNSNFGVAQAIKQAVEVASARQLFGQMARVYAPIVRELDVTSQLGWFAADAALLFLGANDPEAARAWLGIAEREAGFDPGAADVWLRAWPLARMVAGDSLTEWRAERLQGWWNRVREKEPEQASRKATLLFGLLSALEDPVPSTAWRGLVETSERSVAGGAGLAVSRALVDARDSGRVGEAIALVLIAVGSERLETLPPATLVAAVAALYGLGLEGEARRLAFEIAVASGL